MKDGERALITYLTTRRSIPSVQLDDPGPTKEEVRTMLSVAARVPDHGKLAPWRFVVYPQAERERALPRLAEIAGESAADERDRASLAEKSKAFAAAPLAIGVLSRAAEHPKIPVWEQQLSAGAACLNLLHAAHALGYSAQWLTGWFAYDEKAASYLGAAAGERFCGFIYIGVPKIGPTERDRPDIAAITTAWRAAG